MSTAKSYDDQMIVNRVIESNKGWECPGCGRCYSPDIKMCMFCGPQNTHTSSDSNVIIKEPNELTKQTLEKTDRGKDVIECKDSDDLMEKLDEDEKVILRECLERWRVDLEYKAPEQTWSRNDILDRIEDILERTISPTERKDEFASMFGKPLTCPNCKSANWITKNDETHYYCSKCDTLFEKE